MLSLLEKPEVFRLSFTSWMLDGLAAFLVGANGITMERHHTNGLLHLLGLSRHASDSLLLQNVYRS